MKLSFSTLGCYNFKLDDMIKLAKKYHIDALEVRGIANELDNEIIAKKKELEDVKKQFDIYKAKMESLLISQLELIKDINKEDA